LLTEKNATPVGLDHAARHAKAGCLARTVGTQQADNLTTMYLEIDTIDDTASTV
jgi:hypothetical protein